MSNLEYVIISLSSSITVFLALECYSKLSRDIILKVNSKVLFVVLILGMFVTINTYSYEGHIRAFINFLLLFISGYIVFKDSINKTLLYMLYSYIIMMIYEIILAIILVKFKFIDLNSFDSNILFKSLYSFILMLLSYYTCYIPIVKRLSNTISKKLDFKYLSIIFIIAYLAMIFIDTKYTSTFSSKSYYINIALLICMLLLLVSTIISYIKANNEMQKSDILLKFMSKYERIIDNDRINRHEMLNNLLLLKSIKNKNSKEFDETLNDLIVLYNKKGFDIRNIYNLPSGLKGIFYYKLNGLDDNGYNIRLNVSKQVGDSLKKLPYKDYLSIYRTIGILLDNSIEAASKCKDKFINIDIYKEGNKIIIIIENSYKGKIDLDRLNEKYYSTKGKNRGLGLYIINDILKDNDNIKLDQTINGKVFSSILEIKIK